MVDNGFVMKFDNNLYIIFECFNKLLDIHFYYVMWKLWAPKVCGLSLQLYHYQTSTPFNMQTFKTSQKSNKRFMVGTITMEAKRESLRKAKRCTTHKNKKEKEKANSSHSRKLFHPRPL